ALAVTLRRQTATGTPTMPISAARAIRQRTPLVIARSRRSKCTGRVLLPRAGGDPPPLRVAVPVHAGRPPPPRWRPPGGHGPRAKSGYGFLAVALQLRRAPRLDRAPGAQENAATRPE